MSSHPLQATSKLSVRGPRKCLLADNFLRHFLIFPGNERRTPYSWQKQALVPSKANGGDGGSLRQEAYACRLGSDRISLNSRVLVSLNVLSRDGYSSQTSLGHPQQRMRKGTDGGSVSLFQVVAEIVTCVSLFGCDILSADESIPCSGAMKEA